MRSSRLRDRSTSGGNDASSTSRGGGGIFMRAFLERIAPVNNVRKITKPLFIVQGKNDPRVPLSESEQMLAALKKTGTPVWYLMAADEGHGFAKKKNADFQFYATVLFMERYLLAK